MPTLIVSAMLGFQARAFTARSKLAHDVQADVEYSVRIGAVLDNLDGERSLATSITSLNALGFSLTEVNEQLGLDLWPLYLEMRASVDEELAAVDQSRSSPELLALLARLPEIRAGTSPESTDNAEIVAYYDELTGTIQVEADTALERSLTRLHSLGATELADSLITVQQLNQVTYDGARWLGNAYLASFLPSNTAIVDLAGLNTDLNRRIDEINRRNPELMSLPAWERAAVESPEARVAFLDRITDLQSTSTDELIGLLNSFGPIERERVDALDQVNTHVAGNVTSRMVAVAEEAASRAWLATFGSAAVLAVLAIGVWHFATRINAAFRVMEERANRLSNGDLGTKVMTDDTPNEMLAAHTSMDTLVAVLTTLQDQANALADGDLDAEVLGRSAGGALGQAFAGSIDRVRRTASELRESEQVANTIIDAASDAIMIVAADGRVARANPAAESELGRERVGREMAGELIPDWKNLVGRTTEVDIVNAAGETRSALLSAGQFHSEDGPMAVLIWRDITERKRDENHLRRMAHYDALTGLLNRAGVLSRLQTRIDSGEIVSVIFLDLDQFKPLNDVYGHEVGDHVLGVVARRLEDSVRDDDHVARLGGDEFVVVTGLRGDAVGNLVERLVESVERPIELPSGATGYIGISAGWSTGANMDCSLLLRQADIALYAAKGSATLSVVAYDEEIARADQARRRLETELRTAIAEEQLTLFGQPVVDIETGVPVGIEMEPRWNHPERGLLAANEFLPVADLSDLVIYVDRWLIARSIELLARLPRPIVVSINVSDRFVRRADLVEFIRGLAADFTIPPNTLQLEVTEADGGVGMEIVHTVTHELSSLGIRVAVDEFGVGSSSLTDLARIPCSAVKLATSIVAGVGDFQVDSVIGAVVGFARTLSISVVADGIESAEQAGELKRRGCRRAQGDFYRAPAPVDVLLDELGAGLHYPQPVGGEPIIVGNGLDAAGDSVVD